MSVVAFNHLMMSVLRKSFLVFCGAERLSSSQFLTLHALAEEEDAKMVDLARDLPLSPGATTSVVDQLTARGLVLRGHDAEDRRAVRVSLTEDARRRLDHFEAFRADLLREAVAGLAPAERARFRDALHDLLALCDETPD